MSTPEVVERRPAATQPSAGPAGEPAADRWAPRPITRERAAELAAEGELRPVNEIAPLRDYLRGIWRRRHFLWSLARSRFAVTNSQDRLGAGWNVLRPLLQAAVYTVIFDVLLSSSGAKPANYPEYVTAGVFVYTFLSGCLISGASGVVGELGLVRSIKFPRAVLPLSGTVLNLLAFLPALGVLLVLLTVIGGVRGSLVLTPSWLLVVPATLLMTVFSAGAALACARMTVIIRDFSQLLPFALRLMFYLSGTIVDVTRLGIAREASHPDQLSPIGQVLAYEPFHVYMELVRGVVLPSAGASVTLTYWAFGVGWAVLAVVGGLLFFWRGERDYGK